MEQGDIGWVLVDLLGEQVAPSGDEFRILPQPQVDEDDEEDQHGPFVEGHGSQILVLLLHQFRHLFLLIFIGVRLRFLAVDGNEAKNQRLLE